MDTIFGVIGGLGLFLFGMRSMSEGLQKAAGERLKHLLEVLTTNRLSGVLMGTIVTALVQSSSTTTVMVVGFVNARLMTLSQAVGVIMGANIGTTVTAQLIAFQLDRYTLPAIGLGAALSLFARSEKMRFTGQVVLGFGVLFLGLNILKESLRPLQDFPLFRDLLVSLGRNPLLGVLAGAGLTVAVQSSSASIGLLQSLAAEGLVTLKQALPILFGDNIGTTITAVLSAIGASLAARRAAAIHVVFNLVGTILFLIALPVVTPLVVQTSGDIVRQIANAHTIFNLGNTFIQLPIAGFIVWLVLRLVPGKEPAEAESALRHLDKRILGTPSVALNLAKKEALEMAETARTVVAQALDGLLHSDNRADFDPVFRLEHRVNELHHAISHYLADLGRRTLSNEQKRAIRTIHNAIVDIERVADHGENIAELGQFSQKHQVTYSEQAIAELQAMADHVLKVYDLALQAWAENDFTLAEKVFAMERTVDGMEKDIRSAHIDRLNEAACHPTAGVIFLDLASNLERIADHGANIASLISDS